MKTEINFEEIIPKFDALLERGLCKGVGTPDGQMCIEAAIATSMELPFNDEPSCVEPAVRNFKISLNDSSRWISPESRAKALRSIGIAQIGSSGIVDGREFTNRLAEKTIRVLIPKLFREVFKNQACLDAAEQCEKEGTSAAADAASAAADASYAAADASYTASAKAAADASSAAAAHIGEKYLVLSADLALEVLRELKSPGCEWIDWRPQ